MSSPTDVTGIVATQGGTAMLPTSPLNAIHLQSSDPAAAPFTWVLGTGLFSNQRDSIMWQGYNVAGNGTALVPSEPVMAFSWENHYFDGTVHSMEWNFQTTDQSGYTTRPLAFYADRTATPGAGMYWWFRIGASGASSCFQITDHSGTDVYFQLSAHTLYLQPSIINLTSPISDTEINVATRTANLRITTNNQSNVWYFTPAGHLVPGTDGVMDLGRAAGPLRFRNAYFSGGVQIKTKAGPPTDADFTNPADGMLCLNSVGPAGSHLYARLGGAWLPLA